ncbi:hypothetical protein B0G82_1318 [Paraburkholderia sp. BL17N1]|nr:hypothetical protein B0G82_1318 [Paraburkholderia sp. BL17N1]
MRSRSLLELYYPPLPLLCRPGCHPGRLAVRDSHVSPQRQTHDLRYGVSRSRHRIRFMACATFGLRCSRASAYQPDLSSTHHAPQAHIQGSLLRWGTHTPNYRLKLSRDPRIPAWCRAVQVSPHAPAAFLRPHQPTCRVRVTPFEFRTPPGADFHRFEVNRVGARCRASRVRVAQHRAENADWVERSMSASSARFSRTSQSYPACS